MFASYEKVINLSFEIISIDHRKLNVKARYQIDNCIDDDDEKMIVEEAKFKKIWNKLFKKYRKNLKTIDRQYFIDFINYKKFSNLNIQVTYIEIIKMSRKITKFQLDMKIVALFTRRFQTLLKFFSKKYDTIRDDIDAQIDFDLEKSF